MGKRVGARAVIAAVLCLWSGAAAAQEAGAARSDEELDETVTVLGRPSWRGGLMSAQEAPQVASTVTREAIEQGAPSSTFIQVIESVPGLITTSDDAAGLNGGNFTLRGFKDDEVGVLINGVPINDSGNYRFNASHFSDADNIDHVTVLQGWPSVNLPMSSAAGGAVSWVTLDPSRQPGLDISQSFGENQFRRTFIRGNTGDLGPLRAWASYSIAENNLWSGAGSSELNKVEGRALWTIDAHNSISVSVLHSRHINNMFLPLTVGQAAVSYDQGYTDVWSTPQNLASTRTTACNPTVAYNACFYQLRVTPFENWLYSANANFTLTDSLRLSVVPYYENKGGGVGSTARIFTETTDPTLYRYLYVLGDVDGDGLITDGARAIGFSNSVAYTRRLGVIAEFTQEFGDVDALTFGVWWERPRKKQDNFLSYVDPTTGIPDDIWTRRDIVRYPNGEPMQSFNEVTHTESRKVFMTNTWTPNDRWIVSTGLAYIHVERSGYEHEYDFATSGPLYMQSYGTDFAGTYNAWTPSGGVTYQLDDANQFYIGFARTFRPPVDSALAQNTAADHFNQIHGLTNGFSAVNEPETSRIVDFGWRFYTPRLSASIGAYDANFRHKTVQGYDANSDQTVITDLPRVHMQGINAEASVSLTSTLTLYGSYAHTMAHQEVDLNAGDRGIFPTTGKTLTNVPEHAGYLRLNYQDGPVWANLSARYRGEIFGDWSNQQRVDAYTRLDFSAGYDFPNGSYVKLNVTNLTDERAFQWSTNSPFSNDAGPDTFSMLQPRSFMITVGVSLN